MAKPRAFEGANLRELGISTLSLDKATKSRLKRLAGDTPLSAYVRELVEMVEQAEGINPGGGVSIPLPGQERLTSSNTLASVGSKVSSIEAKVNQLITYLDKKGDIAFSRWDGILYALNELDKTMTKPESEITKEDLLKALRPLVDRIKQSRLPEFGQTQLEAEG